MHDKEHSTMALGQARQRLAYLWFVGAGLIFLLLIVQSVTRKYEGADREVWSWALPTIIPTLSLILAVLGASALEPSSDDTRVRSGFYGIAFWMSAGYLVLILATILAEPLTTLEPLALFKVSNLWLAPLQGLVTSAIGVLFFTRKPSSRPRPRKSA